MPSIRLDATLLLCATLIAPSPARSEDLPVTASWRPLGDPYWEGAAWTARAEALGSGAPAEAAKAYEEALRCWTAAGAHREEAHALASIGSLLNRTGQPREALGRSERALALARAASDRELEARALNGVGESRALLFEAQAAFDAFTELYALQRELGNGPGEVEALGNLGYVYLQLGDYVEAADCFSRALEAARRVGARAFEPTLLNNLGKTLFEVGDWDGAVARFEASLALQPEDSPQRAYAMVNLATVHRERGDLRRALELFEGALAFFQTASNRWAQAAVLNNLGLTQSRLGDPDRAYELHTRALAVLEGGGGEPVHGMAALHFAAQAELKRGRPQQARVLSERAVSIVESIRREQVLSRRLRSSLLAPTRLVYEGYVDALMELHRRQPGDGFDALAFEVGERARARSLLELLADGGAPQGDDPPDRWAQPLTLAELRTRALDTDTVVVAYLLGDERSHVWAWTGESLLSRELPPRARLAELARGVHERLSKRPARASAGRSSKELADRLAELGREILSPVAAQLGSRRIAVVADGPLHYVPFAALPDPERPEEPLLMRHEVVTLPSASTLALLREASTEKPPPSKGVAVFADPVFDGDDERLATKQKHETASPAAERLVRPLRLQSSIRDVDGRAGGTLGRLPFTRQEARGILRLAGRPGSRGALGFDANLDAVHASDMADFRFVHFATHGLLDNERPELSGLVLSLARPDGRPRPGFLSVEEILKLRWRAELVTLSGCRTGLGHSVHGEGLVGMTRAFMVAGAPRVVASLWGVDDSATSELMKRFYAGMLGPSKRSPAAALRQAQLDLRRTRGWSAPYYWAAFQLHGDWR